MCYWYNSRHIDQWRGREPRKKKKACIYGHVIYDKCGTVGQKKRVIFSKDGTESTGYPYEKQWNLTLTSHHTKKSIPGGL